MPNDGEHPVVDVLIQNRQRFLAFLIPRVGDKATAKDILHSAYLKGLERRSQLERHESATAWLYCILRNVVIGQCMPVRRRGRKQPQGGLRNGTDRSGL
jgi:RNA polymerase sigma-70 factor (ECF subfamily)